MYIAIIVAIVLIVSASCLLLVKFVRKKVSGKLKCFVIIYSKTVLCLLITTITIYSINWSVPYHSSLLMLPEHRAYSIQEIITLREFLLNNLNEAAAMIDRDENNNVIYPNDSQNLVINAMQDLGHTYPLLLGYYPNIKYALCSEILDFMRIGGYTYPYTLEVTCNKYITKLYAPTLIAHEFSHHKGFYKEDEANFISYLACSNSQDLLLKYSAYDSAYAYINSAFIQTLFDSMAYEDAKALYLSLPQLSDQVYIDELYCEEMYKQQLEKESSEIAKKIQPAAETVADAGWKTQSTLIGDHDYDGLVDLLLRYYDGILY